jgi:hypothetical protein
MTDEREERLLGRLVDELVRTGVVKSTDEGRATLQKFWDEMRRSDWGKVVQAPGIMALQRYFLWADRMREHLEKLIAGGPPRDGLEAAMVLYSHPYMSYFYGGMYVLIEGWRELGLADPEIDELLNSPNVELLRRHRNGAFHFQKDYFDDRFIGFVEAEDSAAWIRALGNAFSRWFQEFPKRLSRENSERS